MLIIMPRYEFETKEEFTDWARSVLTDKKYDVVYTWHGEVIAVPKKSTRPIVYGYVPLIDKHEAKKFAQELEKMYHVCVFSMKKFVWSTEREPQSE